MTNSAHATNIINSYITDTHTRIGIQRAGAIIYNNEMNAILLVKGKEHKKWGFPKGQQNDNESCFECAVRETLEETNINIKQYTCYGLIYLKNTWYYIIKLDKYQRISPRINDVNEISDICFMKLSQLNYYNCNSSLNEFKRDSILMNPEKIITKIENQLRNEKIIKNLKKLSPSLYKPPKITNVVISRCTNSS